MATQATQRAVIFGATAAEYRIISQIAKRAYEISNGALAVMDTAMDLDACHSNGCPLHLADLLAADDFNFAHDVFGIRRHLDRRTGKLGDCFVPRFACA
jgi:hypothetical protein